MINLSIKFILQELVNNVEDRERFNKVIKLTNSSFYLQFAPLEGVNDKVVFWGFATGPGTISPITKLHNTELSSVIRIALSRVCEETVLKALGGKVVYLVNEMYQAFDIPLRNGEGLDKALKSLDKYFIEKDGIVQLNSLF